MGMFDTVRVPCPKCKAIEYFQSKGGSCDLIEYDLHDAPLDVLSNVNRHAPYTCRKCRTLFKVSVTIGSVGVFEVKDEEDNEN